MARLDDATLLARARDDPAAVGEIFDRHCDGVYRHLLLTTQDRSVSEALTREVFATMLQSLNDDLPQGVDVVLWLSRITEATLAAYRPPDLRRPRTRDPRGSTSRARDGSGLDERVLHVLEALPDPAQRSVLALRLGQDLSIAEIAAVLPLSRPEIATLLRQGLVAVRDALAE